MDSADRRTGRGRHRALGVRRREALVDPGLEATLRTEIDEVRGLADELVISLLLLDRDDPATVFRVIDGQRERLSRFERRVRTGVAQACLEARTPDRGGTSEPSVARGVDHARRERRGPARRLDLTTALAAAVAAVLAVVTMGSGTSSPRLLSDRTDQTGGASAPDDRAAATGEGVVSGAAENAEPGAGARGDASSGVGGDAGQDAAPSSSFGFGDGPSDASLLAPIGDLLASLLDITRLDGILSRLLAGDAGDGSESFVQLPGLDAADVQTPGASPGGDLGAAAPDDEHSPQDGASRSGGSAEEPSGPDATEDDESLDLDVSSTVPPPLTDPDESSEEERSTDGASPEPDDGETDGSPQDGDPDSAEDGEASDGSADANGSEDSTRSDSPDESDEVDQTSGYRPLAEDSSD